MDFLSIYNDYSFIKRMDERIDQKQIFHYTDLESLKGILEGVFWATDMVDFVDVKEGRLAFDRIPALYQSVLENDLRKSLIAQIDTHKKRMDFWKQHHTYVLSFCLNSDSDYMWKNYGHYQIVLNKKRLIDSLFVLLEDGSKRNRASYFKHAPVIYDSEMQDNALKNELKNMASSSVEEGYGDLITSKLMYLGNLMKQYEDNEGHRYYKEEEYRIWINALSKLENGDGMLIKRNINRKNSKHFTEVFFDTKAVEKIICFDKESCSLFNGTSKGHEFIAEVRKDA